MRTLDYLVKLFPEKTGAELLEIQRQDKIDDEHDYQLRHAEQLKEVEEINTNGYYFRGTFGSNQYFYYAITKASLESDGQIYVEVEQITLFTESSNMGGFSMKKEGKEYIELGKLGHRCYERIQVSEWVKINKFIESIPSMFWNEIKNG